MAMQIDKTFVVRADPARVWELLTDPFQVAACLPGASVTEQVDEKTYKGKITVKVGPVATSYQGTVIFERLDGDAREAELSARGMDVRGKGGADMKMKSRVLQKSDHETQVQITSEVSVTGILAQLGRGMIQDVSDQMFQRLTASMQEKLGDPAEDTFAAPDSEAEEQPPIELLSFGGGAVLRAIGRGMTHPAWILALVLLALLALWLVFGR